MTKNFFVMMMTTLLCSSTAYGQVDPLVRARETYTSLYRAAPIACRAPQCSTVSGRARVTPRNLEEYQVANRFLIAGARACLVDCTCNVQNATTPSYCTSASTEQATAPAPAAPRPTPATPTAPAPAPAAASTPRVAATPALPPYMPQGMFQGQSYANLGYCQSTVETISTFQQIGIFDAIWFSNGARPQIMSMLTGNPTALMNMQGTSTPITIPIEILPSRYVMVIAVNGREVVAFRNGQPLLSVQQRLSGGYCVRGAIPSGTSMRMNMQLEGSSPTFDIEVSVYMPTPSGALGAPVSTRRATYHSADVLNNGNRPIIISSFDGGIASDI